MSLSNLSTFYPSVTFVAVVDKCLTSPAVLELAQKGKFNEPSKMDSLSFVTTQLNKMKLHSSNNSNTKGLTCQSILLSSTTGQDCLYQLKIAPKYVHKWLSMLVDGRGHKFLFHNLKVLKKSLLPRSSVFWNANDRSNVQHVVLTLLESSHFELLQ